MLPLLLPPGQTRQGEAIVGWADPRRSLHHMLFPAGYLFADMMLYDLRDALGL